MASSLTNFTSETQLAVTATSLTTTLSTEKKFIGKVTFTNTSASNVEVTVWRLLTATTATTGSGGNWLAKKTILPGKVWVCTELMSHTLGNSMEISALAGTADVINADLSGVTET